MNKTLEVSSRTDFQGPGRVVLCKLFAREESRVDEGSIYRSR